MGLLSQNTKMKNSSQNGITVFNFTIPAFQSKTGLKTCPNAGQCAAGCYARMGTYQFGNVKSKHEANLEATQSETFVADMIAEISLILKRKSVKHLKLRIHDAGDFYSLSYFEKWISIMRHFETESRVSFYAYSKQVEMIKAYQSKTALPVSFRVIFSYGGKQDAMIQTETDFHSRVFESVEALNAAGYVDGTVDDMVAALGNSNKIGLVYHGAKSYSNTAWDKVKAA
jgi:hypothetical protein